MKTWLTVSTASSGVTDPAVEAGRRVREVRALGRDDRADEPVERHIGGDLIADPAMKADRPLHPREPLVAAQAIGPLQGPEVDILGAFEQRVDQPRPLVGPTSSRNATSSSGVGTRPIRSRYTRRQNMASSLNSDGGMRSSLSLAKTCWSMKLFSGGSSQTSPGTGSRKMRRLVATRCSNETRIVVSPASA